MVDGVSPPISFLTYNANITNLERAVNERVFYVSNNGHFEPPPRPQSGAYFADRLRVFDTALNAHLFKTTPITRQAFAGLYEGRRRVLYERAAETLLRGENIVPRDAEIRCFVKAEKVNFTAKSFPAPRVISPRSPRYNVEVGRYLRPIEDRLYKAIARVFGEKTVMKGMNAVEQGALFKEKWDKFRDPVAIGLDASRFDQHVSVAALRWEHAIYARCFRAPGELERLLEMQLHNKVRGYCVDGKLKYTSEGGRMSGDMNTSLGNCLLMCAMVYCFLTQVGVESFSLANNGDDCVVICESHNLSRIMGPLNKWFLDMGFSMKIEDPVYELERIEFCQTKPVLGPRGYTMVRCAPVALAKDAISLVPLRNRKEFEGWLAGVGQGGLAIASGIPIYQSFYRAYIRGSHGAKPRVEDQQSGLKNLSERLEGSVVPISAASRFSFYLAFGITPCMQLAVEAHYDGINLDYKVSLPYSAVTWLPAWM
jgi:hypothetical protein